MDLQQAECGNIVGKTCSELFDEEYSEDKIKGFLVDFNEKWAINFPVIFNGWKRDDTTGAISSSFLSEYAASLSLCTKERLLENERMNLDYISYNLQNTVKDILVRLVAGKSGDYPKLKRFMKAKTRSTNPDCGKAVKVICSKLFQQEYNISRMKGLTIKFYHKYKDLGPFPDWPKDEYGLIKDEFLSSYAAGLLEHVKREILTSEHNNPNYHILNLPHMVYLKAKSFIIDEIKNIDKPRRRLVNEKMLAYLKGYINLPELTLDELKEIIRNPYSQKMKKLKEELLKTPGLDKAWFKLEKYSYTNTIEPYIYIPEASVTELINFVTHGSIDSFGGVTGARQDVADESDVPDFFPSTDTEDDGLSFDQ